MKVVALVFFVSLAGLVSPLYVWAQDNAADLLPSASALGEGWSAAGPVSVAENLDPSFRSVAGTVYAGPNGMRAVVIVYRIADGMTAVRGSWEIANSEFEGFRSNIDYEFDFSREKDIASSRPVPGGCSDTRRTYGTDEIGSGFFDAGLTLCAADPDTLVLVYVSGPMLPSPASDASDDIVSIVLSGPGATPAP